MRVKRILIITAVARKVFLRETRLRNIYYRITNNNLRSYLRQLCAIQGFYFIKK